MDLIKKIDTILEAENRKSAKSSPRGKAIDLAKKFKETGDKSYIDQIRKVLSFQTKPDIDAFIKQHTK